MDDDDDFRNADEESRQFFTATSASPTLSFSAWDPAIYLCPAFDSEGLPSPIRWSPPPTSSGECEEAASGTATDSVVAVDSIAEGLVQSSWPQPQSLHLPVRGVTASTSLVVSGDHCQLQATLQARRIRSKSSCHSSSYVF